LDRSAFDSAPHEGIEGAPFDSERRTVSRPGWQLLRPVHADFRHGMARRGGKCECGNTATEVVRFDNGDLSSLCTPCRTDRLGLSSEERKAERAKQAGLFK
jgi:hypothetical protein